MRTIVVVIAVAWCFALPLQARELNKTGAVWEKNLLVKAGKPRGCFYATVSRRTDVKYDNATLSLYFRQQPEDRRYSSSDFAFNPFDVWGRDDFKLDGETGDVLEACVAPGRYALSSLSYHLGAPTVGPYSISWPRDFAPMVFEIEAGRDYYLGNFFMQPGPDRHVVLRDRLARDTALIREGAKHAPAGELRPVALHTGADGWLRSERQVSAARVLQLAQDSPMAPPAPPEFNPPAPRAATPASPTAPPAPGSRWWRRPALAPTDAAAPPPASVPATTPDPPDGTAADRGGRSSSI